MIKNFSQIVDSIKKNSGLLSDQQVAKALGMSKTALYNHKKRGSVPWKALISFCERKEILIDGIVIDHSGAEESVVADSPVPNHLAGTGKVITDQKQEEEYVNKLRNILRHKDEDTKQLTMGNINQSLKMPDATAIKHKKRVSG